MWGGVDRRVEGEARVRFVVCVRGAVLVLVDGCEWFQ